MKVLFAIAAIMLFSPESIVYAQDTSGIRTEILKGRPYSPYADRVFPTDVYFGDTHVHTGLSADAGGGGTRLMPRDAYRLARGEQVVPNTGQPVKLAQPLDFYMITEHNWRTGTWSGVD